MVVDKIYSTPTKNCNIKGLVKKWLICNFFIGCMYRREYGERIKRLQASGSKGFGITANCTNITEALHVSPFNQTMELCKI